MKIPNGAICKIVKDTKEKMVEKEQGTRSLDNL